LIQWGLALGMAGAVHSLNQYAERKLHEAKLKELGEEEYTKWAKARRDVKEDMAKLIINVIKLVVIFAITFVVTKGLITGAIFN